ncbi:MAG: phytanoyl-CoA dioxygenase family protein [Brevundimonas sp.]|uniref:phytanoyl-CoA dioxygenase family protein n=1 Tax=Brevundimonas sp. TaxID=1871086 RepID=UPI002AB8CB6C|nr:phytanoyl-CoA dioxygenase family protein [Brevundimonas sp.]MDZ4113570.1 phytanoyl-CoA dioxygenase family protein [Brevundimonas sp.]
MVRPILRDSVLQARFDADGYVRAPMLDAAQVAALLAEIATLRPADGFAPDGSGLARNSYHCTFLDTDPGYRRATFDLLSRHFAHMVERHLAGYRMLSANLYVKPPGQGDFPIHQNWPVLEDFAATSVTLWCPLVDVDVRSGTLHLAPASHKLLPHIEGPGAPAFFAPFADQIHAHMTPIELPAGEGVIFDDSIVHGSPPNRGENARVAVQIICVPEEMAPVFFFGERDGRFEVIEADVDFYLEHGIGDLFTRRPAWRSRGHIESRNRLIEEAEFLDLLSRGADIRAQGMAPPTRLANALPVARQGEMSLRRRLRRILAKLITERGIAAIRRLMARRQDPSGPGPIRDARGASATHDVGQVRAYYEAMTPAYVAGFGEIFQGSRPESTEALLDYLTDAASIEDGMRILDAGCGVGGPAVGIASRRDVVIEGVTLAQAQVDQAARRIQEHGLTDRVKVRRGDYHALGSLYEPESFDRVLFLESLCHAESYADVLTGAHRVLKTGGGLYIKDFYCVDNRARPSMSAGQVADLEKLHSLYRLQIPDLASTVDLLSGLGFMIRYMRMPDYEASYTHWEAYEKLAGAAWNPVSAEPGDIIQAVEFFCWKR